jgi:hypothetical protein
MARLGVTKKKKSPRATELSQLKKEVQRLTEQLESCKRELAEGIEREIATGDILRVIASSPTELQPVLDTVAESAARLCEAEDAVIIRVDGDLSRLVCLVWIDSCVEGYRRGLSHISWHTLWSSCG